jgi:hypothetical protein
MQPVIDIANVSSLSTIYSKGTDYILVKDTSPDTYGSFIARDRLFWLLSGQHPQENEEYEITYSYDGKIVELQGFITNEDNKLLGTNVLVRHAIGTSVVIALRVSIFATTDATTATNQIVGTISAYINSLKLGEYLDQSDVVSLLRQALPFVDNINLPFQSFYIVGRNPGTADRLIVDAFSHFVVNPANITVTFV